MSNNELEISRRYKLYKLDSSIKWPDKAILYANGDIIDSDGRIIGHITPDIYKEIAKGETFTISFEVKGEEE